MLELKDVNVTYGAIHAIHDVSLTVNDGEIVSLIGANGAGKTTILHTITGLKKAAGGDSFRRRAADAGGGTCADEQSQNHSDG